MVTGLVQMVINGELIVDEVLEEVKGTAEVRPRNLQQQRLVGGREDECTKVQPGSVAPVLVHL